jgi:hypothetical protein
MRAAVGSIGKEAGVIAYSRAMSESAEVSLKEFESIRAEIAAHQRTKSQYLTLAITATGAIGSFALGRDGNRDALLVLPLVLSGLTIIYLRHNVDIELLGQYVRRELWPFLSRYQPSSGQAPKATPIATPSWDDWIQQRRTELRRESAYGAMGILPPLLIFGAPSLGALVIAYGRSRHHAPTMFVWSLDILVVAVSLGLTLWSYTAAPGWKREPGSPGVKSDAAADVADQPAPARSAPGAN